MRCCLEMALVACASHVVNRNASQSDQTRKNFLLTFRFPHIQGVHAPPLYIIYQQAHLEGISRHTCPERNHLLNVVQGDACTMADTRKAVKRRWQTVADSGGHAKRLSAVTQLLETDCSVCFQWCVMGQSGGHAIMSEGCKKGTQKGRKTHVADTVVDSGGKRWTRKMP